MPAPPDLAAAPIEPDQIEELRAVARTYASGVDRRDLALFLQAFHPDATLAVVRGGDDPAAAPRVMRGHDEIGRVIERIGIYSHTFHFLGQSHYVRTEPGASGEVSCIAHHRWHDDVDLDHVMYIRYRDEYRRGQDGRWRIAARTVGVDWSETRVVDVPGRSAR